jgi:diguanylate cyclase (GGDEF)-like protein
MQLLPLPDGTPGWWLVSLAPPPTEDTLRDPLTGLADRRLLLDRVSHALSRRPIEDLAVELVVLDVDEFKAINDAYGHVAGDQVLVEVAARLATCVRPSDTVARWGGDEFVVLLEEGRELGGAHVCERIGKAMVDPVPISDTAVPIAVSAGWVRAAAGDEAVNLLHRADLEMYRVKRERKQSLAKGAETDLMLRLKRARHRASDLATIATDAQARAQLVMDAVSRRRELGSGSEQTDEAGG